MQIYLITGNDKKYSEISRVVSSKVELVQKKLDIMEKQSTNLLEISAHKALQARDLVKKPLIVDDSGVFMDEYKDFPGPFAKFTFQQLGFKGLERLLINCDNKGGKMMTVISYMDGNLKVPLQFIGEVKGSFKFDKVQDLKTTDVDMPFNHIFYPQGYDQPAIEIYEIRHTKLSHRNMAVQNFNKRIEEKGTMNN